MKQLMFQLNVKRLLPDWLRSLEIIFKIIWSSDVFYKWSHKNTWYMKNVKLFNKKINFYSLSFGVRGLQKSLTVSGILPFKYVKWPINSMTWEQDFATKNLCAKCNLNRSKRLVTASCHWWIIILRAYVWNFLDLGLMQLIVDSVCIWSTITMSTSGLFIIFSPDAELMNDPLLFWIMLFFVDTVKFSTLMGSGRVFLLKLWKLSWWKVVLVTFTVYFIFVHSTRLFCIW